MSEENKPLSRGEMHTPKNTTVLNDVELKDPTLEDLDDKARRAFITIFLGTAKKPYQRLEELMERWLAVSFATNAEQQVAPSEIAALKANLDEFVKTEFPELKEEEVNELANRFYTFMLQLVEQEDFRHSTMLKAKWQNETESSTGEFMRDIRPLKPSAGGKFSMRDAMRRGARRAKGDPENISVLLRNSFISFRMTRPTILELSRLIDNINAEIKGYVRQINSSSLTLARLSIVRVIWRFVADRITWCSVKDTTNYYDLVSSIRMSDMRSLAVSLIMATTSRGVDLMLEHHTHECNWVGYKRVDPALLVHHNNEHLNPEQAAVIGNLLNQTQTYSREEIAKLQDQSTHGLDLQVYSPKQNAYLKLKDPTLLDAFTQFDAFVARINPNIRELRANIINDEQYNTALSNVIASVMSSEYAHYVTEHVLLPDEGSDEPPTVYKRSDDPAEFSEGIIDVLADDPELGANLIRYIRNNAPAMSFTTVGVPNFICPKCRKSVGEDNGVINGITPVDSLMAFFIHTQLIQRESIYSQIEQDEEAL